MPSRSSPMPATSIIIAVTAMAIIARPAANFPLITSSRWIGWERSRGSVPCARSPLIASNPNAIPSSGAMKPTRAMNEGTGSAPMTNRPRKSAAAALASSAASRMAVDAAYTGAIAARASIASRIVNRMLVSPSASSLRATTAQPGPRRRNQSSSAGACRSRTSGGAATPFLLRGGGQASVHLVEAAVRRSRPLSELRHATLGHETTAREDAGAVAEALHLAQQVAGEEHREPTLVGEAPDQGQHLADASR